MVSHVTKFSGAEKIKQAIEMMRAFGVPVDTQTEHRRTRAAKVFLAVADIRPDSAWTEAKSSSDGRSVRTRDIIDYLNQHWGETISSGSYDDIRRKDLVWPVLAGVVEQPRRHDKEREYNDGTKGYALNGVFAEFVRKWGSTGWAEEVAAYVASVGSLKDRLHPVRHVAMTIVTTPSGAQVLLTSGAHNDLQRTIVEEFLPRFGRGAELLYLGDAKDKSVIIETDRLRSLGFFDLDHAELPDVVAYSPAENWVYVIEAVYSTGPISPTRKLKLENSLKACTAGVVFVTAFRDRATMRAHLADLAWEQEIWIADEPDHLIHFNGDKFVGPHK